MKLNDNGAKWPYSHQQVTGSISTRGATSLHEVDTKRETLCSSLSQVHSFDGRPVDRADRADFLFRAAWSSAPIILDQTSPESISIFQFILEIYKSCEGNWPELASHVGIELEELRRFLDYSAVFLGNIGNYFVSYSNFTFTLV
jgi:hypothetical protein